MGKVQKWRHRNWKFRENGVLNGWRNDLVLSAENTFRDARK
jgi:hypothetical protein